MVRTMKLISSDFRDLLLEKKERLFWSNEKEMKSLEQRI